MKILMWIIHHFIRPVWSFIFGFIMWYKTLIEQEKDLDMRDTIRYNKIEFNNLNRLDRIVTWMTKFEYTYDGPMGALDHDNFPLEFHAHGGDCDDMARYGVIAINKLPGFKARRVHIWTSIKGKKLIDWMKSLHYVIYFSDPQGNKYIMNYHQIKQVSSLKAGIAQVADWYSVKGYDYVDGNICLW